MRSRSPSSRSLLLVLPLAALLATSACRDEVPTGVGADLFPDGVSPVTLQTELPAEVFYQELARHGSFVDPRDTPLFAVASRYQGRVDARLLSRLESFPTEVTFSVDDESRTDTLFAYVGGTVRAAVDPSSSASEGRMRLELWSLVEEWDRSTATWELAVDTAGERRAWQQPGGGLGERLAEVEWEREGEAFADTVRWELDSLAVASLAEEGSPSVAVVAEGARGRLELGRLALELEIRPESAPDTVLLREVGSRDQLMIFHPPAEETPPDAQGPDDPIGVGGLFGHRVFFRIDLDATVPTCPPGAAGPCPRIPLRDVTLNQAALVLARHEVADGFSPIDSVGVRVYEVAEPELGRLAPLGRVTLDPRAAGVVAGPRGLPVYLFAPHDPEVALPLTGFLAELAGRDDPAASLALVGSPEGIPFGIARFDPLPRLRLVYSLPATVRLP